MGTDRKDQQGGGGEVSTPGRRTQRDDDREGSQDRSQANGGGDEPWIPDNAPGDLEGRHPGEVHRRDAAAHDRTAECGAEPHAGPDRYSQAEASHRHGEHERKERQAQS